MMPFPGGIAATANGTLILSVAAALLYLFMTGRPPSPRRTAAKTAAVGLLAVLAAIEGGPWLLLAALALGAAGDFFLAAEGQRAFLAGLASFLAAHLAYVALFVGAADPALAAAGWWRIAAAALLVPFCAGMFLRLRPALPPGLVLPVAAYVLAILAMGLAALAQPVLGVTLGALLFLASDALLATEMFLLPRSSPHRDWIRPAVWATYYPAQLLIALGVLLAGS